MIEILIALLLFTVWAVICALCGVIGYKKGREAGKAPKLTEEEQRKLDQEKRELTNFWNYTGDNQGA